MKRSQVRVLVLEDEVMLATRIIPSTLNFIGIVDVDVALTEKDARELLDKRYDLMILDTFFGKGSKDAYGPRVLAIAREIGKEPKLAIASSCDGESERLWVGNSKADYFLRKPYSMKVLTEKIKEHFPEY